MGGRDGRSRRCLLGQPGGEPEVDSVQQQFVDHLDKLDHAPRKDAKRERAKLGLLLGQVAERGGGHDDRLDHALGIAVSLLGRARKQAGRGQS